MTIIPDVANVENTAWGKLGEIVCDIVASLVFVPPVPRQPLPPPKKNHIENGMKKNNYIILRGQPLNIDLFDFFENL